MGTNPTGCTEWERDFDPVTEKPKGNVMEPPLCKACGKRHWSRMCLTDRVERHADRDETVTRPVTGPSQVTEIVTPRQADLETDNKRLAARVTELEDEVGELKRELAKRAPMTAAERQRASRAKRKAKA